MTSQTELEFTTDREMSDELLKIASSDRDPVYATKLRVIAALLRGQRLEAIVANLHVNEPAVMEIANLYRAKGTSGLKGGFNNIDEVREAIRENADPVLLGRLKIVLAQLEGMPGAKTAKLFGVPKSTATTWLQFYRQGGIEKLRPKERPSRTPQPSKLPDAEERIEHLLALAAETDDERFEKRLKMIAGYLKNPKSSEIASQFDVSSGQVTRLYLEYLKRGVEALTLKAQRSQGKKLTVLS